jgi:hypothetical protein
VTPPRGSASARPSTRLRANAETLEWLERLGELQSSTDETALALGVEAAEVIRFLAESRKARRAFDKGRSEGLQALRRAQLKLAGTNATMAIFLGKTYLGQAERRESEQSGAIDFSHASQRVRDKLAALAAEPCAQGDRGSGETLRQ